MAVSRELDLEMKAVVQEEWLILLNQIAAASAAVRLEEYFVVQIVQEWQESRRVREWDIHYWHCCLP